ncbi:MAG: alpha-galactosidase [Pseudomonadota bacterium]
MASDPYFLLQAENVLLIIFAEHNKPARIVYLGSPLNTNFDPLMLDRMILRPAAPGGPLVPTPVTLLCGPGDLYDGAPGLRAHRSKQRWRINANVAACHVKETSITIIQVDEERKTEFTHFIELEKQTGVLSIQLEIKNLGETPVDIAHAPACVVPLPSGMDEMISFSGRWANEFQTERRSLGAGGVIREQNRGRPGHDGFPGIIFCTNSTTELTGPCLGGHLASSGNNTLRADRRPDGEIVFQAGENLPSGGLKLRFNGVYRTPKLFLGYSENGLSDLSNRFHKLVRDQLLPEKLPKKPRLVHYNTWEAVYFFHSLDQLKKLADAAAQLGVERFVLDDGWFQGRRHDRAGLGDWRVDRSIYPDGLHPLIDHVKSLGMEFGLWVEPEMVNLDSDLCRAHPDWTLTENPNAEIPFRHQHLLNLTLTEVRAYLLQALDDLLTEYEIDYLKWDMNRDFFSPKTHEHVTALYSLIGELRTKHPTLEIESCASGGGRSDFGILQYTDRIWTSDSNDPLDRQHIQRGASYFLPLSVLGAHVGPETCHITGRKSSMEFRAATAMFGHMGVEANILDLNSLDKNTLKMAIQLYKRYRPLLHHGNQFRLETDPNAIATIVSSSDYSEAIASFAQLDSQRRTLGSRLRFAGLSADKLYHVKRIWPKSLSAPPPFQQSDSIICDDGFIATGAMLMNAGIQLPALYPQTAILFAFEEKASDAT